MSAGSISKHTIFIKGLVSSAGAQVISVLVSLVAVPISLGYFGPLKFGIWMVISSIVAILVLSQFGTGTACSVMIAKQKESQSQGAILRNTLRLLYYFALILIVFTGLMVLLPHSWGAIFGDISGSVRDEAVSAAIAAMVLFFLRLPTIAFTSAFTGLQEVHLERLFAVVLPSFFSFFALLLTIYFDGDLIMLAAFTGVAQLLAGILAGFYLNFRHRGLLQGVIDKASDAVVTKELLTSGARFFFIGIAAMVVWSTDNLVISYFLGPESVTPYAVTFKIFSSSVAIFVLMNSVLMPMFGNAIGKSEWGWLSTTYESALSIVIVLGGLIWVAGIVLAKPVIELWTGLQGYGGALVVFALGGYGYVLSAINLHANLLSSMDTTRVLWIGFGEAMVNFVLSIMFVHWLGIGGVALGTFLSALLTAYWLLPKDIARQTQSIVKVRWSPVLKHFCIAVLPGIGAAYYVGYTVEHGPWIWAAGICVCVAYLFVSWLILPQRTQGMVIRIARQSLRSGRGGGK